jgi:hypothetical protein
MRISAVELEPRIPMNDDFQVQEWEVWHTYSTYLDCPSLDLLEGAVNLVKSEVAECVVSSTGRAFWQSEGTVAQGTFTVQVDDETGQGLFKCVSDDKSSKLPTGFALEAMGQTARFVLAERRVLGEELTFADESIRAYLGKVVVVGVDGDRSTAELNLYPVLVVYQSGVLVLELRMIGPPDPISLSDFINYAVNLPRTRLTKALVNPGLARTATAAYYRSSRVPFFNRFRLSWSQILHNLAIEQRTAKVEDEDFSFRLSPWSGKTDSLRSVALSIFHTCAYLVAGPRSGLSFLLRGPKVPPSLGQFWSGRPHVHVIRIQDQRETASENNEVHAEAFYSILSRTPNLARALPRNLRLFEDYSAFITSSSSLWVWSKQGLAREVTKVDPNRGNFIYERQLLMELLEYGYMLHRGLYHRIEALQSTDQVMDVRRYLLELRLRMRESSHSGEIRELLEAGWDALGLPTLISEIDSGLALRESEMRSADTMRATRVGWAIAILFGIVAIPGLADQVVTPAWHVMKMHPVTDADKMKLLAAGIATSFILALLTVVLWMISWRNRRS